jgi:hypothetical protein
MEKEPLTDQQKEYAIRIYNAIMQQEYVDWTFNELWEAAKRMARKL